MERFGVSMPPELLARFDDAIEDRGYPTRSQAIRDLVRDALIQRDLDKARGDAVATITIAYDPEAGRVTDHILRLQHEHEGLVRSTTHLHLRERLCLEVIVAQGKTRRIKEFSDRLRALRGVEHGGVVLTRA